MTTGERKGDTGATLIDVAADWLMTQALGDATIESLLEGCCNRLRAAGVPISRAYLAFRTLHPLYRAVGLTWTREGGIETVGYQHHSSNAKAWKLSPHHHMIAANVPFLRRRLTGDEALLDFPVLEEVRDQSGTDYFAFVVPFGAGDGNADHLNDGLLGSWATDRPTGFSDRDIRSLLRIQRRLAVACKVTIMNQIAHNVLNAYLGPDAGRRVLAGHIQRGDGETIHAVIFYSDLRESTHMADTMAAEDYLAVLNTYFECTAGAVIAQGGEVRLLIGDAVLAIFPVGDGDGDETEACRSALAAACEAHESMAKVNAERSAAGGEPLAFGVGLHVGDLMYGNIGVPERLEFTVVGAAVNEAARLESLTKELGRDIVASGEFARNLDAGWDSLGEHELRGVGTPREVFAAPVQAGPKRKKRPAAAAR